MILEDSINRLITASGTQNPLYTRNLIKEELQNYILHFVFTDSRFNKLIFTGGTCLRKVYGINRLSEDLDFDSESTFDIESFAKATQKYFQSVIQYPDMHYSISGNKQTIYCKFPILKKLNYYARGTPEDIFVRCDFSKDNVGRGTFDKNNITAGSYQFFVTSYDLSTLFANKIAAFLERVFFKGKMQKIPFKGRDVYDVFWLTQLSGKSGFGMKPNFPRLKALLAGRSIPQIRDELCEKVARIDPKFLYDDLLPLLESKAMLDGFIESYREYLLKNMPVVLHDEKAANGG